MEAVTKMCSRKAVVFSILLPAVWCVEDLVFPTGFMFGSATSAYQVEGAWNVSDKSESIWDRVLHSQTWSTDGTNGDVACDSYHQWRRDVEMAVELGLHFYRFSISWPRLLPTGFANQISEDGKNYYNNLIDALLERGIQPLVTIFHWDLPQNLQDLGGWTNPLIVEWFEDYARVVYSLYADRVHWWITINEPTSFCDSAYSVGLLAPGIIDPDVSLHLCSKHVLLAHAKAWRVYDMEYKSLYHGKVSICNNWIWYEPKTESDVDAAELAVQYVVGKYTHPIYSKEGGWPPAIEEGMNAYGARLGFRQPRLPPFTEEERELVKGTYDYYAFNHYCSFLARHATPGEDVSPHYLDGIVELDIVIEIHPEGLRRQIAWMREKYGDMEFIITENGYTTSGAMNDFDRMDFIYSYLEQVWLSIYEDGANITGYSYWSLMDSFEWNDTRYKFGLYHVDFNSTDRTRSPRASADYYKSIIRNKAVHNPRPKT